MWEETVRPSCDSDPNYLKSEENFLENCLQLGFTVPVLKFTQIGSI